MFDGLTDGARHRAVVHGWDYADELEPLTETLFTSDEQLWRLEGHDASAQLVEIDDDEADAIVDALLSHFRPSFDC